MSSPETFWTRLDRNLGAFTQTSLEKAAGLGAYALGNARKRGNKPTLDTVLAVCRVLSIPPETLLGDDTPPELRGAAAGAADPGLPRIKLANLTVSHLNPRRTIDEDALAELAESIAKQGLLQNLVVRKDAAPPALFWIVAGERRYRALELLRRAGRLPADLAEHGIPCRVVTATDGEHTLLALLENMQRQDVPVLDEAEAMHRLHSIDPKLWSAANIAQRLGVSPRLVQLRLQMVTKLVPAAKEKLRTGEINLSQARVMASRPEDEQLDLLDDAINGCDAAELARVAAENMFPAAHALFDVPKSKLETWADPEGEIFLTDFKAAFKLQEKAVAARKKALLASNYPTVEVVDWFPSYHYTKGAGAVIEFNERSGKVIEHLGVAKKPDAPAVRDDGGRLRAAQARYLDEHNGAHTALRAHLRAKMSFAEAHALFLWGMISPPEHEAINYYARLRDDTANRIAGLAGFSRTKPATPVSCGAAFETLLKAKNGSAENAFVEVIADLMAWPEPGQSLQAPLIHLAAILDFDIAPILLDDSKQRVARTKAWADEAEGQMDIEDAIADAAA